MNTGKLIAIVLIASLIGGFVGGSVGGNQSDLVAGITNLDSLTLEDNLVVNDTSTLTGTTTIALSPDGFVLTDDFTVSTSTTVVRAALTNNGAPLICNGRTLTVKSDATAFAPAYYFVIGTTTSATAYSANLLASSTAASSTDQILSPTTGWMFELANGSSITLSVGDTQSTVSSSTYYTNWDGQLSVHCWTGE